MISKWQIGVDLLQEAIDTIKQRGALRDGDTDLIDEAARACGRTPDDVLDVMLAIKHVRFLRAGDWDSAVDFMAYKARAFAERVGTLTAPRTAEVPVKTLRDVERELCRAVGLPFDDDEPPLRAGKAVAE